MGLRVLDMDHYAMDYLPGKVVAVNFTQDGKMSLAWGPVDQRTISFLTLVGSKDNGVLVATNINPNATKQQIEQGATGTGYTYTEQWSGVMRPLVRYLHNLISFQQCHQVS